MLRSVAAGGREGSKTRHEDRLASLIENAILALVIELFIRALFLEVRLAFWVTTGTAISFVGGLVFLPLIGVSINLISMFGFLVVLGIGRRRLLLLVPCLYLVLVDLASLYRSRA